MFVWEFVRIAVEIVLEQLLLFRLFLKFYEFPWRLLCTDTLSPVNQWFLIDESLLWGRFWMLTRRAAESLYPNQYLQPLVCAMLVDVLIDGLDDVLFVEGHELLGVDVLEALLRLVSLHE
jgi:hypothetical protein